LASPQNITPTRAATVDDDLRDRLIDRVMVRDGVTKQAATQIVNRLQPHDLVQLEMEVRDHDQPTFTSDYDPYGRT
jgi:DNA-binding GntR family transcriptional regulator